MESPRSFTIVADTTGPLADFGPYVASIDGRGRVAFCASVRSGGTGIFLAADGSVERLASSGELVRGFTSHPDVAADGSWCAYAELSTGEPALVGGRAGRVEVVDTGAVFARIGPLGPTMNDAGDIAFRADAAAGVSGVFLRRLGAAVVSVADTASVVAFEGLPVVDEHRTVVYRAELPGGVQAIRASDGRTTATLADTTTSFAELGRFPCAAAGRVAFTARRRDGRTGVFVAGSRAPGAPGVPDEPALAVDTTGAFKSVRGALVDDRGAVVFFGTPRGGSLGIHDSGARPILAIGDRAFGSTVVDFALNPVSINAPGQLAIRVTLANGVQLVVRADP